MGWKNLARFIRKKYFSADFSGKTKKQATDSVETAILFLRCLQLWFSYA